MSAIPRTAGPDDAYAEFRRRERKSQPGLEEVLGRISSWKKGKKVLLFCHDDPDGVTSGAILIRMLRRRGLETRAVLSTKYDVEMDVLEKNLKEFPAEALIVSDKGTLGRHDEYAAAVPEVLIIDHHPNQGGMPKKCAVFNPAAQRYVPCCTAMEADMISRELGTADDWDGFLCLAGLKADWVVEPATGYVGDYARPCYEAHAARFPNLVEVRPTSEASPPTMFEVRQREKTTLLNQIAEAMFAATGGGFQYFYHDREPGLRGKDQPVWTLEALLSAGEKPADPSRWKALSDYHRALPDADLFEKVMGHYRADWEKAASWMDTRLLLGRIGNTSVYLFVGDQVPLMPMAGAMKIYEIQRQQKNGETLLVMVNREKNGGVHFSIRSTGDEVHSGKICGDLAERLIGKYGQRGEISGGGHPKAAECKTRASGVPPSEAMRMLMEVLCERFRDGGGG